MAAWILALIMLAGSAGTGLAQSANAPTPEVVKELAPTGRLRAAINLGNPVLAQGTPEAPSGVSVDLAREVAKRTGLPLDLVPYTAAGLVFEAVARGAWDIAFIAIEPVRAEQVEFTAPYVLIEGTYMVRKNSPLQVVGDVDKPGHKIVVGINSAYDLFLTRTLKAATLVRVSGADAIAHFMKGGHDAVAGVRQPLETYAAGDASVRVMRDRFQQIAQAMGTPKGRIAAADYLQAFIEEMKASGFVRAALDRSAQPGASVAPPSQRRPQ
jgi:polar amino acid transport system substrate-binding protein